MLLCINFKHVNMLFFDKACHASGFKFSYLLFYVESSPPSCSHFLSLFNFPHFSLSPVLQEQISSQCIQTSSTHTWVFFFFKCSYFCAVWPFVLTQTVFLVMANAAFGKLLPRKTYLETQSVETVLSCGQGKQSLWLQMSEVAVFLPFVTCRTCAVCDVLVLTLLTGIMTILSINLHSLFCFPLLLWAMFQLFQGF